VKILKCLKKCKDWMLAMIGWIDMAQAMLCPTCAKHPCQCGPLCKDCGLVQPAYMSDYPICKCEPKKNG